MKIDRTGKSDNKVSEQKEEVKIGKVSEEETPKKKEKKVKEFLRDEE